MGKKNGGQAVPRKAAKNQDKPIVMGGTIHVAGPDFRAKIAAGERLVLYDRGVELVIQISDSPEKQIIAADPCFALAESDVKISTDVEAEEIFFDHLFVSIKGKDSKGVNLGLNVAQVMALSNVLSRYITAHDAIAFLQQKQTFEASEAITQPSISL